MEQYEKAYTAKELSLTLDIGDSTLRKWCIAIEKAGYKFMRSDQNNRIFVEGDITVLRHLKELVQNHNMQIQNASMLVVDRFGKGPFAPRTGIVPSDNKEEQRDLERSNNEKIEQLLNYVEQQKEFNQELLKRLDEQQKYINERLDKRDQLLMESLRETQETKRLIAAAKENDNSNRTFWQKLFGK